MQAIYNSYFNGWNELLEYSSNSVQKTALAALKVLSYVTIVIPAAIAGGAWLGSIFYTPTSCYPNLIKAREEEDVRIFCKVAEEMFENQEFEWALQVLDEAAKAADSSKYIPGKVEDCCRIALLRAEICPQNIPPKVLTTTRNCITAQYEEGLDKRQERISFSQLTPLLCELSQCYFKLNQKEDAELLLGYAQQTANAACEVAVFARYWFDICEILINMGQANKSAQFFKDEQLIEYLADEDSKAVELCVKWAKLFHPTHHEDFTKPILGKAKTFLNGYRNRRDGDYYWLGHARLQYNQATRELTDNQL